MRHASESSSTPSAAVDRAAPLLCLVGLDRARLEPALLRDGWRVRSFPDPEALLAAGAGGGESLVVIGCRPEWPPERVVAAARGLPFIAVLSCACPGRRTCARRWVEAGADCVSSDLGDAVLLAKTRVYLRKVLSEPRRGASMPRPPRFVVDEDQRTVSRRRGGVAEFVARLSATEAKVLSFLAERPGQVVSCDRILEGVWGLRAGDVNGEIVYQYVSRIKRKLGPHGAALECVYGRGYVFDDSSRPPRKTRPAVGFRKDRGFRG